VDGLARTLRLVVGLGMIGAGSALAAPTGLQVAAWWQSSAEPGNSGTGSSALAPPPVAPSAPAAGSGEAPLQPAPVPPGRAVDRPAQEIAPRVDSMPPPPPPPLPAVAAGFTTPGPALASHYRTTLAVPPPPLLDGQRPPPLAVGWAARSGSPAAVPRQPPPVPPVGGYRVRDGDDLTSIAVRFYGTPAVAGAIWEANRDVLPDPGLLPIGVELRLPDPDACAIGRASDRRRIIDPQAIQPAPAEPGMAPAADGWLQSSRSAGPE
jgi:nucleoid-associated protein YgaU